ncbi:BgTH12-05549 [Blumeria graminis f. sp. triticale]|uniref:GTP-binding protein 8 n=3 Tax=Blumeria graminis TaxID=34373 RepID=A0A9X9MJM6_BLUGR|nr:hypothetical protein BGT96224_3223 [Blumeria graminis f. sp. tritici 96224]CAD6503804.1 BgTH12-05549 [Blumeria graminis f. sp. triticale]VDB90436.1 Bgt-3223 [Blumeria graminis f. sp. tritici]
MSRITPLLPRRRRCIAFSTLAQYAQGLTPTPISLSCHWNTQPPTHAQLKKASEFFRHASTEFLWSKENFKDMPFGDSFGESPEVCFLGRSNVGKSSLLNSLLCRRIAFTSSKPGRTKLMSAFAVNPKPDEGTERLIVMDLPGYGKGGRAEWGQQIIKYLEKRRQLKRAFLLVDAEHGLKNSDRQMLNVFRDVNVPFQVILSKADKLMAPRDREGCLDSQRLGQVITDVKQALCRDGLNEGSAVGEIIACSSEKWMHGRRLGINEVRFAALRAAGLDYREDKRRPHPSEIVTYDQLFPVAAVAQDRNFSATHNPRPVK